MGVVWLAERADGEVKRPVALKLPIISLHNRTLADRFARERDILAQLTHPRIARLYDAGVTDRGQPYLALEYVEGEKITSYCDTRRLGVKPRLQLFLQVLRAAQYAHTNLIVHRDLKPANILVTKEGDVRLLDFGIAKLLTEGEANETELTRVGGRALTPDYASPEQIAGSTVTTASDVYSLGVVLYELLTGGRPYKLKRDTRSGLEDAILAAEPARPSQAAAGETAAQARGVTAEAAGAQPQGRSRHHRSQGAQQAARPTVCDSRCVRPGHRALPRRGSRSGAAGERLVSRAKIRFAQQTRRGLRGRCGRRLEYRTRHRLAGGAHRASPDQDGGDRPHVPAGHLSRELQRTRRSGKGTPDHRQGAAGSWRRRRLMAR